MQPSVAQARSARSGSGYASSPACAGAPVLDFEVFNSLRGMLDAAIVAQIYREFLDQTRLRLAEFGRAPEPHKLKQTGHTLKGTGGMLGAGEIAVCAEQLEHASVANGEAERLIGRILEGCAALEAALRSEQVAL